MPRDIPVGNGNLLVAFDRDYCLRDIYYPYVGQENHTDGHKFRFGVWVDGILSWLGREEWDLKLEYAETSLMTHVTARNDPLLVSLHCNDVVDYKENIYLRKILLRNDSNKTREFRLFFHHDYHILESAVGDTAYFDPDEKAIIHYKGNRYFLMSGIREGRHGIDQYATGTKEFHGLEGTWRDAEDGRLEGAPISQGSVDSTLSFRVIVKPGGEETLYYWITAGRNYAEVSALSQSVLRHGPDYFMDRSYNYWKAWTDRDDFDFSVLPAEMHGLYKISLLILRTNIDSHGAIIAANDSDIRHFSRDTYSYMWPRDGAFAAYALDMAGYQGITRKFFEFCLDILSEGKEAGGFFLHKYNPDGCLGSSWHPWVSGDKKNLPIQEDGTGLLLWALWFHYSRYRDVEFAADVYENFVVRCADFLVSFRDMNTGLPLPSYDLWEEKQGIHTFTVSAVYAGLKAAERFASFFGEAGRALTYGSAAEDVKRALDKYLYSRELGRFLKTISFREDGSVETDLTIDASIYAPFYFGVFGPRDERVENTMKVIKERLWVKTDVGGVARYEGDGYHRVSDNISDVPGNPWFICTLWLAQWYIAKADSAEELQEAAPLIEWACKRALPSGVLAEQVNPFTNQPLSASPLTWSHAALVAAILEYVSRNRRVNTCPHCGGQIHGGGKHGLAGG